MTDQDNTQTVLFPGLFSKPVVATFDQAQGSSDGGAMLLKGADEQLHLTERLAACLKDRRQAGKVDHSLLDLLRQRVYGIACGYADCNDAARLADDPLQKLLLGRDPLEGDRLGSQPSLSRFENAVSRQELLRLGEALADGVIAHHTARLKGKARWITVDLQECGGSGLRNLHLKRHLRIFFIRDLQLTTALALARQQLKNAET